MKILIRTCFNFFLPLLLSGLTQAQPAWQKTWCNPIDINYRYNWEQINNGKGISYRSGADPVIVLHKGEYYLFVTISGGYWHSRDMLHWRYVEPNKWPLEDNCAPSALSVRDTMYIFQSAFQPRPIFYTTQPEQGRLEFYNRWMPPLKGAEGPWDPGVFYDPETDRWFMYFGSSNVFPLYGIELDKHNRLRYKGDPVPLIRQDRANHGWERFGRNHSDTIRSFPEGAWMTKHNGKYYLQYGAPGTEFNVYANGTYECEGPLGPCKYAPYNPVSYKPGGFAVGAGHGNTFQDVYGNYWNTGTNWIGRNWGMERRIVKFPAGFDKDGAMFSNTRFGDFPHRLPTGKWQDRNDLFTGWMLLSYKKPVMESSFLGDSLWGRFAVDEDMRSWWVAKTNKPGESLTVDLQKECDVKAFQLTYMDYKSNMFDNDTARVYLQFRVFTSRDGKKWDPVFDNSGRKEDHPCAYVELEQPMRARYVKFENVYVPVPHLALAGFRVFGNGLGKAPAAPAMLKVKRDTDARNAYISWKPVKGAVGYNILWGIAPDKLYQTYQTWADEPSQLELRTLNLGVGYSFAIEAFDENGVSKRSGVVSIK